MINDVQELDDNAAADESPRPPLWDEESGSPHPWLDVNRPGWSDRDCDVESRSAVSSRWLSRQRDIPTSLYGGLQRRDGLTLAHISVGLAQSAAFAGSQPRVVLHHSEWNRAGGFIGDDLPTLTLGEAVELAAALTETVQLATNHAGAA